MSKWKLTLLCITLGLAFLVWVMMMPPEKEDNGQGLVSSYGDPVKLTFWGGVPAESGPQLVVDTWNKQHPDIQIEYVRYVNDDDGNFKLDTALITDQGVDLYVNYGVSRLERRVEAGVALDLGTFMDYDIEAKIGDKAKAWLIDGKYFALPTKKDLFFYWLNKDALDDAGLAVPTAWTWQDVAHYAEALTNDHTYGLVRHMETYLDMLDGSLFTSGYVKANGTSNMDAPVVGIWLQRLKQMMDDRLTPALGEQLMTKMPVDTMFLNGEAAMLDAGEWIFRSANDLEAYPRHFTIAFAPIPSVYEGQANYRIRGGVGDGIAINAKSEHHDEAWAFLKWYADGGMSPMAIGGRLPASRDANLDEAIEVLLGDHADTYDAASLKHAVFGDFDTFNRSLPQQLLDARKEEYEKFLMGDQDLQTTLDATVRHHDHFMP